MKTKPFPLRVLLSVTTGRLLTERRSDNDNGIGDLYEILGWMTNDSPATHQLPRFSEECKPWLLRWFPELEATGSKASLDRLDVLLSNDPTGPQVAVAMWIGGLDSCKDSYDVPRIPVDDHEQKHPYDELVSERGTDEGIHVITRPPNC